MAESLDDVQQRLSDLKVRRQQQGGAGGNGTAAGTPPRAQTPPRLTRPPPAPAVPAAAAAVGGGNRMKLFSVGQGLSAAQDVAPRSVTPPRLAPPARAASSLPRAVEPPPEARNEPEPEQESRPEQGESSLAASGEAVDVAAVQAELDDCLSDRRDLIEEFLGAEYRDTENLSEEVFQTIEDPTHRSEAREALEELQEHIEEMRQQLGIPAPAPTPLLADAPALPPANPEPLQPRTAAPPLPEPQRTGPAPPPALSEQPPAPAPVPPARSGTTKRKAPAIGLLKSDIRKVAPPLPLAGSQATIPSAAGAIAGNPSVPGAATPPALPIAPTSVSSFSAQPTRQSANTDAAAPLPAALAGAPRSAPPLAALAAAPRGSAASSVSDTAVATPAAIVRNLSNAPPLAALTPATSLPPFGSQYRVVRKGQHYRADAAPNSKKVGKLQIGEALVVQGAEMVDGKVRVLVARPTETDFVRLGWASVAVNGKTHLAPVGAGGVEEVEVFDDEEEFIGDADDEVMSVELWSEGEYGFGISIGEASEIFAPEEEVAEQSSQTCRTVVTLVDEGCSAQQLGVMVGMELLRIGSEELDPHGDAAVERAFEIVEEQLALGVGLPGGDPLVWVFRNPTPQSLRSPRRQGSTRLMLRQFEVIQPATVRNGIGLNSKRLGQLQPGQMIVAMAHAEIDGHLRLQIASDPEQWVSATVPDGTVLLREQGLIGIEDFEQVDTDGDGFMSRAEFTAYRQKQTGQPPTAADWEAFDAADVDGDGQISIEEFKSYRDTMEDRHDSSPSFENRSEDYQQQRQQRSVTFANHEMEPLMLQEQPLEGQQPQTGSLAWTETDIGQIFSTYDRNMDGLLDYEDVLDILIHEMGYEDDDRTSGVADGFMREFGEEMEVEGDGQNTCARMLNAEHWAALCGHVFQLDGESGSGDTWAQQPPMPRGSTAEDGNDNYEYDAENGGGSFLQRQLRELEQHNAEMAVRIKRGEQERVILLFLLVGALGFVVLLLFTDLIITKQ